MPADRLIFARVIGSPGSVHALRYAADLARHDAILVPLLTWVPPCVTVKHGQTIFASWPPRARRPRAGAFLSPGNLNHRPYLHLA
jgi:hypothetical protein